MSKDIVPQRTVDPTTDASSTITSWLERMPLRTAEDRFKLAHGELRAAIANGQIRYYRVGRTQFRVSPLFVAEYIERYKTYQNEPLPG